MKEYILGFDTSNYTTSVAVVGLDGLDGIDGINGFGDFDEIPKDKIKVVADKRRLLDVPKGMRGIRQQDAVFNHLKNLPGLYIDAIKDVDVSKIKAVCVSTRPRPVEGSYMPCFFTGQQFASVIAASLGVPLIETSHQEGHIKAIKHFSSLNYPRDFICFHLSGGTMEILKVREPEKGEADYCRAESCEGEKGESDHYCNEIEIIGKSLDISFGQLIDRVGVKLGLDFPCGKEMDGLALRYGSLNLELDCVSDLEFEAEVEVEPNVMAEAETKIEVRSDVMSESESDAKVAIQSDGSADNVKAKFLALEAKLKKFKDIKITGLDVNISGIETGFSRIIDDLLDEFEGEIPLDFKALIAGVLFEKINKTLGKLAEKSKEKHHVDDIVFAGGVSESRFLRSNLKNIVFGDYGADNAIGVALIGGSELWRLNQ